MDTNSLLGHLCDVMSSLFLSFSVIFIGNSGANTACRKLFTNLILMPLLSWGQTYITEELILRGKSRWRIGGFVCSSHYRWLGWAQVELEEEMSHEDVDEGGMSVWQNDGHREPNHRHIKNKYSTDVRCTCVEGLGPPPEMKFLILSEGWKHIYKNTQRVHSPQQSDQN